MSFQDQVPKGGSWTKADLPLLAHLSNHLLRATLSFSEPLSFFSPQVAIKEVSRGKYLHQLLVARLFFC
jgi:hypothetical protein